MYKVLGLGNALVDLIFQIEDDQILEEFSLPKGSMTLVDSSTVKRILEVTKNLKYEIAAGGSASNTIDGLAHLGVKCGYIGKIGKDAYGELFHNELISRNIFPQLYYGRNPTGTAITLLSKDAERTFATYLGAAIELKAYDLRKDHFKGFSYFHIEGYLVQNHDLIIKAVKLAKDLRLVISIDMASYSTVEANKDFLYEIIDKYIDIVFANEEEARSFTDENPEKAVDILSNHSKIAVVKTGKNGSMIQSGNKRITVPSIKADLIDSTGAGDLYAAGFLFGLTRGYNLELAGNIGSLLGGKVIEVYGARLHEDRWSSIHEDIDRLINKYG
jgi:sugar/nucleoside kinase (ribokinase family)